MTLTKQKPKQPEHITTRTQLTKSAPDYFFLMLMIEKFIESSPI